MTHTVGVLQVSVQTVCLNCGDWTLQTADIDEGVETAEDLAGELSGPTLTERQALAYLLREGVGLDRKEAADRLESTPSNVDNLHRRATEKIDDARRVVGTLDAIHVSEPDGAEEE